MKNNQIKIMIGSVCLILCFAAYFFGYRLIEAGQVKHSGNAEQPAAIANPIQESSAEEIYSKLNIQFHIPETASGVTYSLINGSPLVAQTDFVYKNAHCTARCCDLATYDTVFPDISGVHCDVWSYTDSCGFFSDENVIESKLLYKRTENPIGGIGVVKWTDKHNRVYSVFCDHVPPYASFEAIDDFLMDLAGSIYGSIYVFPQGYTTKIRCGEHTAADVRNAPRIGNVFHRFKDGTDVYVSKRTTQKQERGGTEDFWYYCYYADETHRYEGWIFGGDLETRKKEAAP